MQMNNSVSYLKISNRAIATSGNYRNSWSQRDKICPAHYRSRMGLSKPSDIEATVIADDCATADALATAFMVMGLKDALISPTN